MTDIHRIVRSGQGMGGFLAPPGHPDHVYEVRSYYVRPGKASVNIGARNRGNGADGYASVSSVLANEYEQYPNSIVTQARRIMERAELVCSETWVRSVYGYFRNSYSPDGTDRNVSNAVSTSKVHCRCGDEFWNQHGLNAHLDTHADEIHDHYQTTKPMPPPERHLGYLCVREYFPDHQPRTDLIADPGTGYGSWPCVKCGKRVQYEARVDAFAEAVPSARNGLNYVPECPAGGQHER